MTQPNWLTRWLKPHDLTTWWAEREASFAARKAVRPKTTASALKGAATKRGRA
jgi:hypothetical protein